MQRVSKHMLTSTHLSQRAKLWKVPEGAAAAASLSNHNLRPGKSPLKSNQSPNIKSTYISIIMESVVEAHCTVISLPLLVNGSKMYIFYLSDERLNLDEPLQVWVITTEHQNYLYRTKSKVKKMYK